MNLMSPTLSAVEVAIRNGQRDAAHYLLNDLLSSAGLWIVSHKSGDPLRSYTVDTVERTCSCQQFAQEAVCKHQWIVDEEMQIREQEDIREFAGV